MTVLGIPETADADCAAFLYARASHCPCRPQGPDLPPRVLRCFQKVVAAVASPPSIVFVLPPRSQCPDHLVSPLLMPYLRQRTTAKARLTENGVTVEVACKEITMNYGFSARSNCLPASSIRALLR
jgi:hypothetical protein